MMPRLLLTGASGRLGAYLLKQLAADGTWEVVGWSSSRREPRNSHDLVAVDLKDTNVVRAAFKEASPDVVIHAAAISSMAQCAADPPTAVSVNVDSTRVLAELARNGRARFVYLSTDLVFDGQRGNYVEEDDPRPLSVYGRTKLDGERWVLHAGNGAVVRLAHLYGASLVLTPTSFDTVRTALERRTPIRLFTDEWRTPLDFVTAAKAIIAIAATEISGIIHLGGPERLSRWDMGVLMAECLGLDPSPLVPDLLANQSDANTRPRDVSLNSARCRVLLPAFSFPDFRTACRSPDHAT